MPKLSRSDLVASSKLSLGGGASGRAGTGRKEPGSISALKYSLEADNSHHRQDHSLQCVHQHLGEKQD